MISYVIDGIMVMRDGEGLLVLQCGSSTCGSVFQSSDRKEPMEEFMLKASVKGWRRVPCRTGRLLCGSCACRA